MSQSQEGTVKTSVEPNAELAIRDFGDVLISEYADIQQRRSIIDQFPLEVAEKTIVEVKQEDLAQPKTDSEEVDSIGVETRKKPTTEKVGQYHSSLSVIDNLSGIGLSGGGIRSAALSLGIVQGLARLGILHRFDYLSTVSGGGYLGSFLTTWVQRNGYEHVLPVLKSEPASQSSSSTANMSTSGKTPISHLREYSNYLTPMSGLTSADTLAITTMYLRNLLLNWLLIVPVLAVVAIAVKLIAISIWHIRTNIHDWLALGAILFVGMAFLDSLRRRPGPDYKTNPGTPFSFAKIQLLPISIGGFFALAALQSYLKHEGTDAVSIQHFIYFAVTGAMIYSIAWTINYCLSSSGDMDDDVRRYGWLAQAANGAVVGTFIASILVISLQFIDLNNRATVIVTYGLAAFFIGLFVGESIYAGIASYSPWGDAEREWLARASGYHLAVALASAVLAATILLGPTLIDALSKKLSLSFEQVTTVFAGIGTIFGTISAIFGSSSSDGPKASAPKEQGWFSISGLLGIAAPLFFILLMIVLSALIDKIFLGELLTASPEASKRAAPILILVFVLNIAVIGVASNFININRFSLHGIYRDRIARTFLGASNKTRRPNPFSGFDPHDNPEMKELWPVKKPDGVIPPQLHIFNMALNVIASDNLAWRERKAISFTSTARWTGAGKLTWDDTKTPTSNGLPTRREGCFRPSSKYSNGITVGTVTAISGAAASPNMGYHSSPILSLLLTLFNVRLGAWLGNPGPAGDSTYEKSGPSQAIRPLIFEALGQTNSDRPHVYLSDGGHFDNLGLYELLRRRCQLILISDAGEDPDYKYEDLGSAILKAEIDLQIKIEFIANPSVDTGEYWVGTIPYVDAPPGILIYMKPRCDGTEPMSVLSYRAQSRRFPHEPTLNQSFGEAQFEAYRALGEALVSRVKGGSPKTVKEWFDNVVAHVKTSTSSVGTSVGQAATTPNTGSEGRKP